MRVVVEEKGSSEPVARDSGFAKSEKARLTALGSASLYPLFREKALRYYSERFRGKFPRPCFGNSSVGCRSHVLVEEKRTIVAFFKSA
jgi:hypothetical protein